jgi:hypothetical protein
MAMMSSGSSGSRSYSYTVTETYTLEEAVQKAGKGELSPDEVYRQMPQPLQQEIDRIALKKFSKAWTALDWSQKKEGMQDLAIEIRQAKNQSEKPLSIADALRLAKDGHIDAIELYQALPDELRKALDVFTNAQNAANFTSATPEVRRERMAMLLDLLITSPARTDAFSSIVDQGLDLHNRALELKTKGKINEALALMREAKELLTSQETAATEPTKATVGLWCNLSSARAHVGEWTNDLSVLNAAIMAADHGIRLVEKTTPALDFEHAVLWHNRGHAGWRIGKITHNTETLIRGIQDLNKAGGLFRSLNHSSAIDENATMLAKAQALVAKLDLSSKKERELKKSWWKLW